MATEVDVERTIALVCADLGVPTADFEVVDGQLTRSGDCNGDFIDSRLSGAELFVFVAGAVQTFVTWNVGDPVVPSCPTHNFGLHPEVVDGVGVWRCRPGDHVVAPIGDLTTDA